MKQEPTELIAQLSPGRAGRLPLVAGPLCLNFTNTASGRGSDTHQDHLKAYNDLLAWSLHAGALLAELGLPNDVFGPVLSDLLTDSPEGQGPGDFRSLGVCEFGTTCDGLMQTDLTVDWEGFYQSCRKKVEMGVRQDSTEPTCMGSRNSS